MSQRRVTATNRLSTVLNALQLGKKTGILAVERGEGTTFEEGTILFSNGQMTYATIGSYVGRNAMNMLSSWQACRFSFVPMSPEEITRRIPPSLHLQTGNRMVAGGMGQSLNEAQMQYLIPGAQNGLDRKPLVSVHYKESTDDFLSLLDRQGLSRAHRRLFLLIDGRRSIQELALLIGRMPDETFSLLKDLEQAGLIVM